MSARTVTTQPLKSKTAALIALAVLSGFVCGRFPGAASAQQDEPPVIDARPPVPADTPRRKAFEKLRIPGTDREIFAKITDFQPVASEAQNPREYDAWLEYVFHANKQDTAELNEYGIRDLVPIDFASLPRSYRTELIRFDGKLVCARRLVAPPQLVKAGIKELYEARLVPADESPNMPVSIVFLELPEALAAVKTKPVEEWLDATGWVTASGYFFKVMSVPGERANAVIHLPLLIGKGLTPLPGAPSGSPTPTALDKDVRLYKFIRDDTRMTQLGSSEIAAYNRVLLHASRFSAEELERDAATDVRFADLFEDTRSTYRLSLVKLQGRLISLKRKNSNEWLAAAGVNQVYEGWLIPDHEQRGNPVCIEFTEPVEGVDPARRVNKWVSFAGYSFKRIRYESAEEDPKDPSKHIDKLAPLLIGKKPIGRTDPDDVTTTLTWSKFIYGAVILAALLILSAGLFTLWYRRGDRQARSEMDAVRSRNPFDPSATNG